MLRLMCIEWPEIKKFIIQGDTASKMRNEERMDFKYENFYTIFNYMSLEVQVAAGR